LKVVHWGVMLVVVLVGNLGALKAESLVGVMVARTVDLSAA